MDAGTMVKKYHVLLFVNTGTPTVPVWKRIKKSTDITISMNPEMLTFDYIADESPSQEVDRYAPSLSQPVTMYKGEPDFEFFFDKFFSQAVGADAHAEMLIVFESHEEDTNEFKAWKSDAVVAMNNMNPVESTITADINFSGTTLKGTATVTAGVPVFAADSVTEFVMTVNVKYSSANVEGAVVQVGGVEKLTDASGNATFTLIDGNTYTVGATDGTHEDAEVIVADTGTTTLNMVLA